MAPNQDHTTTALLASLKRRGMLVGATDTLSDADFLAIATEEMQGYVMAWLVDLREEFRVADYDVATVSGTNAYRIPPRAAGDALRQVSYLVNGVYVPLTLIRAEDVSQYSATGDPTGYYFMDNDVILVPSPTTASTLRLAYHRRPSKLVATTAVATISSINGARTVITTAATIPSTMTSGVVLDVVDEYPGFKTLVMDAATTGTVSGTTITLSAALPASVAAGDYVCLAGESPVPQIPVETHPLLIQRTKYVCLESLGDKKAVNALATLERMEKQLMPLFTPRTKGGVRLLVNRYGPGWGEN